MMKSLLLLLLFFFIISSLTWISADVISVKTDKPCYENSNQINISGILDEEAKSIAVRINDSNGHNKWTSEIHTNTKTINTSYYGFSLKPGSYIVEMLAQNSNVKATYEFKIADSCGNSIEGSVNPPRTIPSTESISVYVDNQSVTSDQTITVYGKAMSPQLGLDVTIEIISPNGARVVTEQVPVDSKNNFQSVHKLSSNFESVGKYKVRATYGLKPVTDETWFTLEKRNVVQPNPFTSDTQTPQPAPLASNPEQISSDDSTPSNNFGSFEITGVSSLLAPIVVLSIAIIGTSITIKKARKKSSLKQKSKNRSGNRQAIYQDYEPESFDDALSQLGKNIKKDYPGAFEYKQRPPTQTEEIKKMKKAQEEEIEQLKKAREKELEKRKNIKRDYKINKLSREQIETERQRRLGISIEQEETERKHLDQSRVHSQTISEQPTPKPKPKTGLFSRFSSKSNMPSANQILQSHDPYVIFGLQPDTTCQEVKLQFKELSRIYNASRGSINKSKEEKAQINAIQSRINTSYDTLRKRHCG